MFMRVHICTAEGEWNRLWRVPLKLHQSQPPMMSDGYKYNSYRLERELHERRVVDLADFILGPVISRSRSIDSFLEDSSFSCLGRRRSGSRSNRRECVIDNSAELASPWCRAGCHRAQSDSSREDGQRHDHVGGIGEREVLCGRVEVECA
jgi:hypothetical protein